MKVRVAFSALFNNDVRDVYLYGSGENADGEKYYTFNKWGNVETNPKDRKLLMGDYVANADGEIVGIIKEICEPQTPDMTFEKANKEQRQGRENRKDAESILCELLANHYLKEINTPFFDLLKWAVLEFTGHNQLFELVKVASIVIVNNKGKRVLWFKGTSGGTSWASCVETLWKVKMPYISVDYVLTKSPVVHYFNGENVSDIKEISDDFIKILKLFLEKLGGGDDSARA